jgi:hypothetical protein
MVVVNMLSFGERWARVDSQVRVRTGDWNLSGVEGGGTTTGTAEGAFIFTFEYISRVNKVDSKQQKKLLTRSRPTSQPITAVCTKTPAKHRERPSEQRLYAI